MERIKDILKEIDSLLRKVNIFEVLIKTLVLLTVSYLFFFMVGVNTNYAFLPPIIYFFSSVFVQGRIDYVKRVEGKYGGLKDKLITARDYQNEDNVVLEALEESIVNDMKKVELSNFFSYHRAVILIFLLIVTVSASLYIASQNVKIIDINDVLDAAVKRFTVDESNETEQGQYTTTEESIMQVGDEKIEVEINPVGMDIDFSDVEEIGDYTFQSSFPREVFISSGAAYETEFTEEQQLLIQRYFERKKT
ncbi:hypothetical protein GOV09_03190 [Candidatus Woesearchaeota archaeon]|nr:hypothetical protein [Candidatus Woesearchaeota archaeon]